MVTRTAEVRNPQGLHARPASLFVKLANQFRCEVWVTKESTRVEGKSILGILALGAAQGEAVMIEARGEDAELAVAALVDLVGQIFDE